jgi:hypothetical protein
MTIAPHVEIIPPMTQIMRAMPTEPLSLKIVAGVENILYSRQYKVLMLDIVVAMWYPAPMILFTISEMAPSSPISLPWRTLASTTLSDSSSLL